METIFDHAITKEELTLLFGAPPDEERYRTILESETANADLYRLYSVRGDVRKAKTYLNRIKDPLYRFETSYCDIDS
jgi:hypothetical protein